MADEATMTPPAPTGVPTTAMPVTLNVAGAEMLLPPVNDDDKKAFSLWSAARAIAKARAMEAVTVLPGREPSPDRPLSRDDFFANVEQATLRATAGGYSYNSEGGYARRSSDEGLAYLCWVCLRRANPPGNDKDPGAKFADVLAIPQADLIAAFRRANGGPASPPKMGGSTNAR